MRSFIGMVNKAKKESAEKILAGMSDEDVCRFSGFFTTVNEGENHGTENFKCLVSAEIIRERAKKYLASL